MKPSLEITSVSKKFKVQHLRPAYLSLRDHLITRTDPSQDEEFNALKDISFSVNPGESVGIIGRNGAGKSTLLKILSRITPPSTGKIILRGKVASLLEVGTGFHQELTGRENIFLNGSILGMKRYEINDRFDEIVDFAGTEKFLDTPLKHYSSGMQLRLAFAVAAFLNPEILIIDEVLAVGDAEFQRRCLRKMEEVSSSGRTILFVSHNLAAINNLCSRAILLNAGCMIDDGVPEKITSAYFDMLTKSQAGQSTMVWTSDKVSILKCSILNGSDSNENIAYSHQRFVIRFLLESKIKKEFVSIGISVEDLSGTRLFGNLSSRDGVTFTLVEGKTTIEFAIEKLMLNSGFYFLTIAVHEGLSSVEMVRINQAITFEVINTGSPQQTSDGVLSVTSTWSLNYD